MRSAGLLVMGLVSCLVVSGCRIVDSNRSSNVSGNTLSTQDLNSIAVGQTTGDDLIRSFGSPGFRADRPDGTSTWKWCEQKTEHSSGGVILLYDRDRTKTTSRCTVVELQQNVVTDIRQE